MRPVYKHLVRNMINTLRHYGQKTSMQAKLGLTREIGVQIATIISFASAIEHFLERAIWRLSGINPIGTKPKTDTKIITELISMLEKAGGNLPTDEQRMFVATWCAVAHLGSSSDITLSMAFRSRWAIPSPTCAILDERRAAEEGVRDFWADTSSLDIVGDAMATLLRPMAELTKSGVEIEVVVVPGALRSVRMARSVLGEFASQTYYISFEKY